MEYHLSSRAQIILDTFRKDLESLTFEERERVLRDVARDIATVHQDVKGIHKSLKETYPRHSEVDKKDTLDNISKYL